MKKQNLIKSLLILFTSVVSFTFCTKKPFTNVKLHGRVVNYMTKAPIQATINLFCDELPGNKRSTSLGGTSTNGDGTFSLKTPAAESNVYYLQVLPGLYTGFDARVSLQDGQDTDVGDFLTGDYTFYCKVTLVSVSVSAIDFTDGGSSQAHYNAGTNITYIAAKKYDYDTYQALGPYFHIGYKTYPNGVEADSNIFVRINLPPDTLYRTINY